MIPQLDNMGLLSIADQIGETELIIKKGGVIKFKDLVKYCDKFCLVLHFLSFPHPLMCAKWLHHLNTSGKMKNGLPFLSRRKSQEKITKTMRNAGANWLYIAPFCDICSSRLHKFRQT